MEKPVLYMTIHTKPLVTKEDGTQVLTGAVMDRVTFQNLDLLAKRLIAMWLEDPS